MHQKFGTMQLCGKRGGPNFLDAVFIDPRNDDQKCPKDYLWCPTPTTTTESGQEEVTRVQCVENLADCPILEIVVSKKNIAITDDRYIWLDQIFSHTDQEELFKIGFSKQQNAGKNLTAVIDTSVGSISSNYGSPCFGPDKAKLAGEEANRVSFPYEYETSIQNCPVYPWLKQQSEDGRFSRVLGTTLFDLQEKNDVYAKIKELELVVAYSDQVLE